MDREYSFQAEQTEDQQSHWKLKGFSSWPTELREQHDPRAYAKTHQGLRGGEALRRKLSKPRKTSTRHRTPEQNGASSAPALEEGNFLLNGQDRKLSGQRWIGTIGTWCLCDGQQGLVLQDATHSGYSQGQGTSWP